MHQLDLTTREMEGSRGRAAWYLTLSFALLLAAVPLGHVASDCRRGESDWALLLGRMPTGDSLGAFTQAVADNSPVARTVRPWTQWLGTRYLGRGNAKTVVGRDGWLFYRVSVDHVVGPPADADGPARAIAAYRDALAAQGVRLLVLPAPGKETVYPERLAPGCPAALGPPRNAGTVRLIDALRRQGVEVVDPVTVMSGLPAAGSRGNHTKPTAVGSGSGVGVGRLGMVAAASSRRGLVSEPLFLPRDTHWSPAGLGLVADEVARRVGSLGWLRGCPAAPYTTSPGPAAVSGRGDLYDMLDLPPARPLNPPSTVNLLPVTLHGAPWQPDRSGAVMLLGDSFSNVYSDPALRWGTGAGLAEQLALRLQVGVDVIALNDGGVNGCREQLARQPARLAGKRVVVWEFAERSLTAKAGEWREIPVRPRPDAPVGDQP